jgi:hypothetical protein
MVAGAGERAPTSKLYRRYVPPGRAVILQSAPAEFTLPDMKVVLA